MWREKGHKMVGDGSVGSIGRIGYSNPLFIKHCGNPNTKYLADATILP